LGSINCSSISLDDLEVLLEVLPVVHDGFGIAGFGEGLCHGLHLLLAFFDTIDTNIADEGDASSHASSSTRFAVFDGDALLRLDTKLLTSVEVDLGVGLAGRRVQGSGSTVDQFVREVLVEADLLERGEHARFGGSADNSHGVSLFVQPGQLLTGTWAFLALLCELLGDSTDLLADIVFKLFMGHLEVMFFLKIDHHAAEVLTNKVFQQRVDGVAFWLAIKLEELIGEVCTGFKGETLRETEGVIAVKENILDL
jgi:hypothetical protein